MASGLRVNEDELLTETFDVRFAAIALRGWRVGLRHKEIGGHDESTAVGGAAAVPVR